MRKRIGILFGLSLALLALWMTTGSYRSEPEDGAYSQVVTTTPHQSAQINAELEEDSASNSDRSTSIEPLIISDEYESPSCDEVSRLQETVTGPKVGIALGVELNEQACAQAVRFMTGAVTPALPGLAGFEIPDRFPGSPDKRLAEEPDDPDWARPMEGKVLNVVAELIDFPISSIHVVCRTKTCGLVLSYLNEDCGECNYDQYAQQMSEQLGFAGYHGGVNWQRGSSPFMTFYFDDMETTRPLQLTERDPESN